MKCGDDDDGGGDGDGDGGDDDDDDDDDIYKSASNEWAADRRFYNPRMLPGNDRLYSPKW